MLERDLLTDVPVYVSLFFFRVKVWSKVLNAQCLKVKSNGLLSPHTKRSKRFETILKSAYKTCTWCLIYFICNHKLRVIMKKMRLLDTFYHCGQQRSLLDYGHIALQCTNWQQVLRSP